MVAGFPRIKKVLALERSAFVNHLLKKTSIEGMTALSTTPSKNLITINPFILLTMPVAMAKAPQRIRDQNINFLALLFAAYVLREFERRNNQEKTEIQVRMTLLLLYLGLQPCLLLQQIHNLPDPNTQDCR